MDETNQVQSKWVADLSFSPDFNHALKMTGRTISIALTSISWLADGSTCVICSVLWHGSRLSIVTCLTVFSWKESEIIMMFHVMISGLFSFCLWCDLTLTEGVNVLSVANALDRSQRNSKAMPHIETKRMISNESLSALRRKLISIHATLKIDWV